MPPKQQTEKEKEIEIAKQEAIRADEELKAIGEDVTTYGEAEAFSKSAGGKKLIASLENDVLEAVLVLTVKYKTAPHTELIGLCAALESKMDLLRRMTQATRKKNEAVADFDKRLQEILGE